MDTNWCYIPKDYLVYVNCITYKHSNYIEAALDGMAQQNTYFPYACVVVDDCSPDGEQYVIKKWMTNECDQNSIQYFDLELAQIYVATHKNNRNCNYAFYLLKQNLAGDVRKEMIFEQWRDHAKLTTKQIARNRRLLFAMCRRRGKRIPNRRKQTGGNKNGKNTGRPRTLGCCSKRFCGTLRKTHRRRRFGLRQSHVCLLKSNHRLQPI